MEVGKKTILGELQNWLEDYAPADQIEKCAKSLELMSKAHSLQERKDELKFVSFRVKDALSVSSGPRAMVRTHLVDDYIDKRIKSLTEELEKL